MSMQEATKIKEEDGGIEKIIDSSERLGRSMRWKVQESDMDSSGMHLTHRGSLGSERRSSSVGDDEFHSGGNQGLYLGLEDGVMEASGPTHAMALKIGMRVTILTTDNVIQRVPHLVGAIGIIKEVPVHPATWFKVVFPPDPKIVTFRPSALVPVDEEGRPLSSYVVKPSVSRGFGSSRSESAAAQKPPRVAIPRHRADSSFDDTTPDTRSIASSNRDRAGSTSSGGGVRRVAVTPKQQLHHMQQPTSTGGTLTLLAATDPDTWVGRRVVVASGRLQGQAGVVRSSGNGWVQVDTAAGEVAKRAGELCLEGEGDAALLRDDNNNEGEGEEEDDDSSSKEGSAVSGSVSAVSQTAPLPARRRPQWTASHTAVADQAAPEPKRARLNSNHANNNSNYGASGARGRTGSSSAHMMRSSTARPASSTATSDNDSQQAQGSETQSLHPRQHPALTQAKRDFVAKYVARIQKKLGNRPNLAEWKVKLNASLFSSRVHAAQAARVFDESVCETCCTERWPAAKFCWNERCPASPVFRGDAGQAAQMAIGWKVATQNLGRDRALTNATTTALLAAQHRDEAFQVEDQEQGQEQGQQGQEEVRMGVSEQDDVYRPSHNDEQSMDVDSGDQTEAMAVDSMA